MRMRELPRPSSVRAGVWVRFAGQARAVLAVSGGSVRMAARDGARCEVPLARLLNDQDFEVLGSRMRMPLPPQSTLDAIPEPARERALWWESHILEVLHGVGPEADAGAGPRAEYDPARFSLTAREQTKATELTAQGHRAGMSTVGNLRRRYQAEGLLGLVDRRQTRRLPRSG
jgi:hypothetical protein